MSRSILIVEDDAITARYLELGLRRLGYRDLRLVSSADDALRAAHAARPDLVLMDIEIEGSCDGVEAARQLRAEFDVPVVFLTSHADEITVARAKQVEPLAYLVKPVKAEDLRTTLTIALHKDRTERSIREQERILATVLEATSDAVLVLDAEQRVVRVNPAAEALLERAAPVLLECTAAQLGLELPVPGSSQASLRVASGQVEVIVHCLQDGGMPGTSRILLLRRNRSVPEESAEMRRLRAEHAAANTSDETSGHLNRRGFLLVGEQQWRLARRLKIELSLLTVELWQLDQLCAAFGARAVEQAIEDIGCALRTACEEGDLVGRLSATRFVVLTPGTAQPLGLAIRSALSSQRLAAARAGELTLDISAAPCDPSLTTLIQQLEPCRDAAPIVARAPPGDVAATARTPRAKRGSRPRMS